MGTVSESAAQKKTGTAPRPFPFVPDADYIPRWRPAPPSPKYPSILGRTEKLIVSSCAEWAQTKLPPGGAQ